MEISINNSISICDLYSISDLVLGVLRVRDAENTTVIARNKKRYLLPHGRSPEYAWVACWVS